MAMFRTLNSKLIYENKWTKLYEDEIGFPGGEKGIYGYIERSNGVGAVVLNDKDEILLIKQYRYPIKSLQWNIPGGAIDLGEEPELAVKREVEEETGLEISELINIGTFAPLSSASTERDVLFMARVKGDAKIEYNDVSSEDEEIPEKRFITIEKLLRMIDKNEVTDALTCTAIQIVERKLRMV